MRIRLKNVSYVTLHRRAPHGNQPNNRSSTRADALTHANTPHPLPTIRTPKPLWAQSAQTPSRREPGLKPAWRQGNGGGRFRSASSDISHNRVVAACRPRWRCQGSANHPQHLAATRSLPKPPRLYQSLGIKQSPQKEHTWESLGGKQGPAKTHQHTQLRRG